jgi:hypothetical protein
MTDGTFLAITPLHSVEKAGDELQKGAGAMGKEERTKLRELSSAAISSSETRLFALSPSMSYPAKGWITADPEFWAAPTAAGAAASKAGKKRSS